MAAAPAPRTPSMPPRAAGPALRAFPLLLAVAASSPQCAPGPACPSAPAGGALLQVSKRQTVERVVGSATGASHILANSSLEQPPSGDVVITVDSIQCNKPIFSPDGVCPAQCPYFAQEKGKEKACTFRCLKATECGTLDPDDDIADEELLICRACRVVGCKTCDKGKGDVCAACETGYSLNAASGTCSNDYWKVWTGIFTFVGIVAVILVVWLVRLAFLPVTNNAGLKEGLAYRSSLKLRAPSFVAALVGAESNSGERPLWPLSTSLHGVNVAGPGTTLHMNFQLALILWGCGVLVSWIVYAYFTSPDMLVLGLWPADTPQQLCSVTLRGKEVQRRLMPTKLVYMLIMYVATSAFNFCYALYQRHHFLQIDDETSMTDFAALCSGLPTMKGDQLVEDLVKQKIEELTGETVVGVSCCWDFKEFEDEVGDATDREVEMMEDYPAQPTQAEVDACRSGFGSKVFGRVDALFGFTGKVPEEVSEAREGKEVEAMLKSISTTDAAFVVFQSETSRDNAIKKSVATPMLFEGKLITLTHEEACEPDTVKWANFNVTDFTFYRRMALGVLSIFVALLVWAFGFYLPFAAYQASFARQGEEPGFLAAFVFSMLVVAGNQIMYFLCAEISERVGFRFNDHQEAFYIALYTLACTLNLAVDMYMEFYLAYQSAIAAHAHTADGQLLEDLSGFQQIFESYVMQKAVGTRLFAYCFPATFFIPFLMEPIFAIILPLFICKLLLRTHPECRGRDAEKSLDFFAPMDMGRYGDLILNLWLSVLIVFFPPGTFLKMMIALVVSHVFVYVYDTYRILRAVPTFDYSSDYIDRLAQVLMGVAPAFLAAGIVFKGGCLEGSPVCLKKWPLFGAMSVAFFITIILHFIMIKLVVPMFDNVTHKEHKVSETPYSEAAATLSSTWFSENRVHCLRSKYVYKHDPPCVFNTRGKEHLIKKNPACGVYFEAKRVGSDEYDD